MTVLDRLADLVVATRPADRVRVAVDGVDASGKTTLADRLAEIVGARRPVARASVDAFHRPRAERYRRGRASVDGCYEDTFDLPALRERLLLPFGAGRPYVCAVFDHARDQPVDAPPQTAPAGAVLLVDGVFLQRPELPPWDLVVHLQVPDAEVLRRAVVRDGGDPAEVERLYRTRYLPAQRLYEQRCRPAERAHVVLDNRDPAQPVARRFIAGAEHGRPDP
jgi:uridine kinase